MKNDNSSDRESDKKSDLPDSTNSPSNTVMLPAPYDIDELANLIQVVHSVSDSNKRFIFDTVLLSMLEKITPLIELYELIPRIWSGDNIAEQKFQNIINANSNGFEVKTLKFSVKPDPLGGDNFCDSLFLLKPDSISKIQQATLFLAHGDEKKYALGLSVIDKIWRKSLCPGPDTLNYLASKDLLDGGMRTHDYINSVAKANNYFELINDINEQRRKANGGSNGLTQPPNNRERPWRPPQSGFQRPPIRECGPDDGPTPRNPVIPKECRLIREWCEDLVRGSARKVRPLPNSVSTANIENITTNHDIACSGDVVTIHGSGFGATQEHYRVVFGTQAAEVISWSDTEIVVRIPPNSNGCIGIRNEKLEEQRKEAYKTNQRAFDEFTEGATACFGQPTAGMLPYRPDTPLCYDFNIINIGSPIIDFRVNGSWDITIEAGDNIILEWSVVNADHMEIKRIGNNGPSANITSPMSGSRNLGAFTASSEIFETYELSATNRCGIVSRKVTIKAIRTPKLEILGIEVTQSIQSFNWNTTNQNNTVKLVGEKLTMVRVHVSSGITDGFDFGSGPNVLPKVRGRIKLTYPSGHSVFVDNILNPSREINAQPLINVNRGILDHSLNFELPVKDLDGAIKIEASIYTIPRGAGRYDSTSTSVTFEKNGKLRLAVILVNDTINGNPAPTMRDFRQTLQGARTRFPISEQGFKVSRPENHRIINTQIRNYPIYDSKGQVVQTIQVSEDLLTDNGWSNLLDRIDDIADDYKDNDEIIWVGLVPDINNYASNGVAYSGLFWLVDHVMLSKPLRASFAHELTHSLGIRHAQSNNSASSIGCSPPSNVDASLVSLTEDIGMDIVAYRLMPQAIPTLMTYCIPSFSNDYQDRWVSIDLWDRLWNKI